MLSNRAWSTCITISGPSATIFRSLSVNTTAISVILSVSTSRRDVISRSIHTKRSFRCIQDILLHIMRILAIETSCDETAIAIVEAEGDPSKGLEAGETAAQFRVLGNALLSQIEIHKEYGGGFPAPAKREHAKNLVPILSAALEEAGLLHEDTQAIPEG